MNFLNSAWARQTGLISGPDQNESFWHLVPRGSRKLCASNSSTFHMPTAAAAFEMGHYPKERPASQAEQSWEARQAEQCRYGVVWVFRTRSFVTQ